MVGQRDWILKGEKGYLVLPCVIAALFAFLACRRPLGSFRQISCGVLAIAICAAAPAISRIQEIKNELEVDARAELQKRIERFRAGTNLLGLSVTQEYDTTLMYAEEHGLKTHALVDTLDSIQDQRLMAAERSAQHANRAE